MKYNPLGNSGLYVSEITLGAMTFSEEGSEFAKLIGGTGQKLATRMVDLALDAGVNIIDTANIYSYGQSEPMVAKALGARRKDVIIATKLGNPLGRGMNDVGVSRLSIMREAEDSLRRLNTDWIDLYQVHRFDHTTPLEETLRALDDLVRSGKVRYIGLSNFSAWQIAKADGLAHALGTERFVSAQVYYSLVGRDLEREILPAVRDLGIGTMIWSPLAGGFLSGKYTRQSEAEGRRNKFDFPPVNLEQGYEVIDLLKPISEAHNASVAQIALAWLRYQEGVTTTIIGATKEAQLIDNLKSVEINLTADEIRRLNEISSLTPEYPHWFGKLERGEDLFARFTESKPDAEKEVVQVR